MVEKAGPDAGVKAGQASAVFPWIGCGQCAACRAGEENLCAAPRHLGIQVDGGFATHVLVPHPRYLIDYAPLSAALAGAYMCSGLTAFSALKRIAEHAKRGPVLLVGLGGVGMMGLAFARALFAARADRRRHRCRQARGGAQGRRRGRLRSGRPGRPQGAAQGNRRRLRRGRFRRLGRLARVRGRQRSPRAARSSSPGLLGGTYTTPIAMFPLRVFTIEGTMTGTLDEANEMMALARAGKIPPVPIIERPLARRAGLAR